jgi:hypothetical protein
MADSGIVWQSQFGPRIWQPILHIASNEAPWRGRQARSSEGGKHDVYTMIPGSSPRMNARRHLGACSAEDSSGIVQRKMSLVAIALPFLDV